MLRMLAVQGAKQEKYKRKPKASPGKEKAREFTDSYTTVSLCVLVLALLMIVQLLVADIAGLMARHTPGTSVTQEHSSFLFRSVRALANTNESVAIFILLVGLTVVYGVDPERAGWAAITFVAGRVVHSICYWADLRILRSVAFAFALIGLLGMTLLVVLEAI